MQAHFINHIRVGRRNHSFSNRINYVLIMKNEYAICGNLGCQQRSTMTTGTGILATKVFSSQALS